MKDKEVEKPKCPMCGRRKKVQDKKDGTFFCTHCTMLFDPREDD